jgi:trans-aconitate 2-methyltransferase
VAEERVFRDALGGNSLRSFECPRPEEYSRLLHTLGYREQHVRLHVYGHVLGARDDVVEWMKGTLLTAYQQRLTPKLFDAFVERYRQHLLPQLDETPPYYSPFKRVLAWAQR